MHANAVRIVALYAFRNKLYRLRFVCVGELAREHTSIRVHFAHFAAGIATYANKKKCANLNTQIRIYIFFLLHSILRPPSQWKFHFLSLSLYAHASLSHPAPSSSLRVAFYRRFKVVASVVAIEEPAAGMRKLYSWKIDGGTQTNSNISQSVRARKLKNDTLQQVLHTY